LLIFQFIKNNHRLLKLFRFCVVGGSAFLMSILIFNLLKNFVSFFAKYLGIASVIGDITALIYGFYINKHWTFSSQKKEGEKYFLKYISLYITTILINYGLLKLFLWALVNYHVLSDSISLNITENLAKIMATVITTFLNFVGTNYVIFINDNDEELKLE
jgi:putative flippase GtrA